MIYANAGPGARSDAFNIDHGDSIIPDIHNKASDVEAAEGNVHVTGPDGVVYSMTPDAASDTSDRLLDGAVTAQGQRIAERDKGKPPTA